MRRWPATRGGLLRLRLLNASNARIYRLALEGHRLVLIATDGGAMSNPEPLDELLLVPGERADVLVQGNQPPGRYRLLDLPYQRSGHRGMGQVAPAANAQDQRRETAHVFTKHPWPCVLALSVRRC